MANLSALHHFCLSVFCLLVSQVRLAVPEQYWLKRLVSEMPIMCLLGH